MIKCKINSLIVVLMLLVPSLVFAIPGPHDSSSGLGFTCNSCHVAPNTYGNTDASYANNVCLTCHTSGNANTIKAFSAEDFADIDSTSVVPRTTPVKTSHKWLGSEVNAKAKALKPVDSSRYGLNMSAGFSTSMACMRCHSVHGWTPAQKTAPYLRATNDTDQMCMNCHRERANSTHTLGSHPVNVSYSSASVKAKASQFKLVNNEPYKNSANPTAEMKIKKGMVVCSSCHGVHVADSNSSTFDTYSSSNKGHLAASDGSLLRVSKRGADNNVDTINVCTNCHTKKHTGQVNQHTKSTVIECNDCHSAHVDYMPGDINQTPNKYLLRRYVNYSGVKGDVRQLGTYRKRLVYTDDIASAKWAVTDGTGVCQACHALPSSVTEHSTKLNLPSSNCISCHANAPHTDAAPAGNCTDCHGQPPIVNTNGGPTGKNAAYATYNESTTPHGSHAAGGTNYSYACDECHKGNNHNSGSTFADVFIDKTGIKAGVSAAYSAPNCATVYCHSDGNGVYRTESWNATKGSFLNVGGTAECNRCHDNNTTSYTGSHLKHVTTMAYGCERCHATTVSNNTTVSNKANHVNAVKDVSFSGTLPTITGSNCSAVYCHSNGKGAYSSPTWGGAAACGSCHATAVAPAGYASTSHATHFASAVLNDTTNSSCTTCHASTHVNGTVDVKTVATSCATCHADPYSTGAVTPPTWNTSATGCNACHSASPIATTGPATGSHVIHNNTNCSQCHTGATTSAAMPTLNHADGDIDVNSGYTANVAKHTTASGFGGRTCTTASCHANVYAAGTIPTPVWGATAANCTACHTTAIATTGPATGSHAMHNMTDCSLCHTGATTSAAVPTLNHADGDIDVNSGYTANVAKHLTASGFGGRTCSTASCHGSSSPVWGSALGNNSCTKCHGTGTVTVTAANYEVVAPSGAQADTGRVSTGKIGAHQTHLIYFNGLSQQGADPQARCQICHTVPGTNNHANANSTPAFTGLALGTGTYATSYGAGTCAVYCHNPTGTGGTLALGNAPAVTTVAWTDATYIADGILKTAANCDKCHLSPNGSRAISATTSHAAYTIATACTPCHEHEGGTGGTAGRQHMDGVKWGGGSCDSCHGYQAASWANYGTTYTAKNAGGVTGHATHITYLTTKRASITLTPASDQYDGATSAWTGVCGICHAGTITNHQNTAVNVALDQTYLFGTGTATYNGAPGGAVANKTCSNLSCHYFTSPQWSN